MSRSSDPYRNSLRQRPSQKQPDSNSHEFNKHNNQWPPQRKMTDEQYFNSLEAYKPVCYGGKGAPIFLSNPEWCKSFGCILVLSAILILALVFFAMGSGSEHERPSRQNRYQLIPQYKKGEHDNLIVLLAGGFCLIGVLGCYFLTQFLNPGIRNPDSIPEQQFQERGRRFCDKCQKDKTKEMQHCRECGVCVWGMDHHCGFFNKCIAGWQKWAFYAFITFIFGEFIVLIVSVGLIASQT